MLIETIEKHTELNPKLFDSENKLKDSVREKIFEIVDTFTETLEEDGLNILIKDIILIGSNASYNYSNDSDLDIHIIADTSNFDIEDPIIPALYSAYRSLFNKKFDISFFDIPVELYVETENLDTVSNGIYSVKENDWIKFPKQTDIPDIDKDKFDKEFNIWKNKCDKLISEVNDNKRTHEDNSEKIIKLTEAIYNLRKQSLKTDGEYGIKNLIFKELRNLGYLDKLKDLRNSEISKQLSLESLEEQLNSTQLFDCRAEISKIAGVQTIMQENGYFNIYNIHDTDVDYILNAIAQLDFVEFVQKDGGRFDWSKPTLPFEYPTRLYTITGKIKL